MVTVSHDLHDVLGDPCSLALSRTIQDRNFCHLNLLRIALYRNGDADLGYRATPPRDGFPRGEHRGRHHGASCCPTFRRRPAPRAKNARGAKQTMVKTRSTTLVIISSGEVVRTARSAMLAMNPTALRP